MDIARTLNVKTLGKSKKKLFHNQNSEETEEIQCPPTGSNNIEWLVEGLKLIAVFFESETND